MVRDVLGARSPLRVATAASCVIAVALSVSACGGSSTKTVTVDRPAKTTENAPTPTPTTGTTTTKPATRPSEAPARVVRLSTFRSPTGNIGCSLIGGVARCDIAKRSWSPPRPASCPQEVDFGQGLQVGASGKATVVCAGDTTRDPASPSLGYGTASKSGDFVCTSRTSGVTCNNASTGHGFTISAQSYKLF